MMIRTHRALTGILAAGAISLPLLSSAFAAPAKKPAPAPKADPKAGHMAFKNEGCMGCHKTKEEKEGGAAGPDLSMVGKEHKPAEIEAYIQKPKPGSIMPAYKAKDAKAKATLANMVAYLATQK